jgi:uncharacterized membrane protein YphA (DoxX/SURF4 family)
MSSATVSVPAVPSNKVLHLGLWVAQLLLAFAFFGAGMMKSTAPITELAEKMVWPGQVPAFLVRFIGVSELAAALGLILPTALRIKPRLTGWAGVGLVVIMVLAAGLHASRAEYAGIAFNVILGAMSGFVAWGRLKAAVVAPRG